MASFRYTHAIVCRIPNSLETRGHINLEEAKKEHENYVKILRELGLDVIELPPDDELPECVFVEDCAVVCNSTALITRPGAAHRQKEVEAIRVVLKKEVNLPIIEMSDATARLNGGDVLFTGLCLDLIDIIGNGFPIRIYDRLNYIEDMNFTFFKRLLLTKPTVLESLPQIEEQLEFEEDRNNAGSPINQLLATLRLDATGKHISSISDFSEIHPSRATRIVKKTSIALASLRERYINMPENEQQIVEIQNICFLEASFRRVVGCVDGTHICIQSPGREFFVGISHCTNEAGARAVAAAFPEFPCTPIKVSDSKHLKSYITMGGPDLLCVGASKEAQEVLKRMEREATFSYQTLTLPEDEGANVLYLNGILMHRTQEEIPLSFKVFQEKVEYPRRSVDFHHLAKLSCGLSSSCLLVRRARHVRNI